MSHRACSIPLMALQITAPPQSKGRKEYEESVMKITNICIYHIQPRWMLLKVETDEGLAGWGEPRSLHLPPRSCHTGTPSIFPLMSHRACSIPLADDPQEEEIRYWVKKRVADGFTALKTSMVAPPIRFIDTFSKMEDIVKRPSAADLHR